MEFLYQAWVVLQEPATRDAIKDVCCWMGGLWAALGVLVATIKHSSKAARWTARKLKPLPPPPYEPSALCRTVLAALNESPEYLPATDRCAEQIRAARVIVSVKDRPRVELLHPHKDITSKFEVEDLGVIVARAIEIREAILERQDYEERQTIFGALAGTVTLPGGGLLSTTEARAALAALQPEPKPKGRR